MSGIHSGSEILVIVLAGGQGERLYPLTRDRAKPAVPFAGSFRIIDFTLSNCVNSGLRKIYVLTQYKSLSLDRHIMVGWQFLHYDLGEFIQTLPAQQRLGQVWYKGTADAIFQNIYTLEHEKPAWVLILAGDHIYKMDYREMIAAHIKHGADLTVGCVPVKAAQARQLGVAEIAANSQIRAFHEKSPNPPTIPGQPDYCLASMGIYVFNTEILVRRVVEDAKRKTAHDFGRNIIPAMVSSDRVFAFHFRSPAPECNTYWRDVGTIDAYWESNMDILSPNPQLNLYDEHWRVHTYQEQRPPAFFGPGCGETRESFIGSGCVIRGRRIIRSVLSPNVVVEEGAEVEDSIIFEHVTIGRRAKLRKVIVDKNVTIPAGTQIGFDRDKDSSLFTVTDGGVTVVPKDTIL